MLAPDERVKKAIDNLAAAIAGAPALPQMRLLEKCIIFLINDLRIVKRYGGPVEKDDAKRFHAKANDLVNEISEMLDAYESANGRQE
jgi:hypothetical protein